MQKKLNFTDLSLRTLGPGEYWDTKLPAFGFRVGKFSRTFFLKKHNRRITIGRFPSVTLQSARSRALGLKGDNSHITSNIKLGEALDLFLASHCKSYRPASKFQAEYLFRKLEPLRQRKLSLLTSNDFTDILDVQKPSTANHLFKMCRTFFRFCVRRSLLETNPLQKLGIPNKTVTRDRVLSDEQLKAIWTASKTLGQFGYIVRLLVATGQRRGEVSALRGSWVHNDTIVFPKEITKNAREHTYPIGPFIQSLLPSNAGLFFHQRGQPDKPFNNWQYGKIRLDKLCGVERYTLHDIRRTYRTNLARLKVPPFIAERMVNHISARTDMQNIYDRHTYAEEMRAASLLYEDWLQSLVGA